MSLARTNRHALLAIALAAAVLAPVGPRTVGAETGDIDRTPLLIADIGDFTNTASIRQLTPFGGDTYFHADDGIHGTELWRYDHDSEKAELVKDIWPGTTGSVFRPPHVVGGLMYFNADDGVHGRELWRTDGTEGGTKMVADIRDGPNGSDPEELVSIDGTVFFTADDGKTGQELWSSDKFGTRQIADVDSMGSSGVRNLAVVEAGAVAELYFTASRADTGTEPWSWDGSALHSREIVPGAAGSSPGLLVADGADLYLRANGQLNWFKDATDPTSTGKAIADVIGSPSQMLPSNGDLFVQTGGGFGGPARAFAVEGDTVVEPASGSSLQFGAVAGDRLVFQMNGGDGAGREPWLTDGTIIGTKRIADLVPGPDGSSSTSFTVDTAGKFVLLWSAESNGANPRTVVLELSNGAVTTITDEFGPSRAIGIGVSEWLVTSGQLWRTDGEAGSIEIAAEINQTTGGSSPGHMATLNDDLAIFAASSNDGQLVRYDAKTQQTAPLSDLRIESTAPLGVGAALFTSCGSTLCELWRTDGTLDGTTLVRDFGAGYNDLELFATSTDAFLVADDELWWSDGTVAGTTLLVVGDSLRSPAVVGELLFFRNTDAEGAEPWVSDGTVAGTQRLDDLVPGPDDSFPASFLDRNGTAVFRADGRLFTSDGTTAGTTQIAVPTGGDIQIGVHDGEIIASFANADGNVAFWIHAGTTWSQVVDEAGESALLASADLGETVDVRGTAMFPVGLIGKSDFVIGSIDGGTLSTTSLDERSHSPKEFISHNGNLYIAASVLGVSENAAELWIIDRNGPRLLLRADDQEGRLAETSLLGVVGDTIVASARTLREGTEPHAIDGRADVAARPTNVTAVAGDASAVVSWTAPVDDGGTDISGYTVTTSPGGATCSTTSARTCTVAGLTNDTPHTFTVVATTAGGDSTPSTPSATVTPTSPIVLDEPTTPDSAPDIVSLTPARVLDSRPGESTSDGVSELGRRIAAGEIVEVVIAGRAGVDDDALAAVLNLTAVNPDSRGFFTMYPCGERPLASSLNATAAGAVVGNEVVAKLSENGSVCVYASTGTHLTADVVGFAPVTSAMVSLDPARFFETRAGEVTFDRMSEPGAPLTGGNEITIPIAGRGDVPDDAAAVIMNVTAINPIGRGFLTLHPCGDRPLASSLNFSGAGAVAGNEVISKLSDGGAVCVHASATTELTIDVVGYAPEGSGITPLAPARFFESRPGEVAIDAAGQQGARLAAESETIVQISGRGGVPDEATAAVMNLTAINPSGRGFLTMYPCGDRPLASSLNHDAPGVVAGNEVVAKLSPEGAVCNYSFTNTHLTIDVVGYVT